MGCSESKDVTANNGRDGAPEKETEDRKPKQGEEKVEKVGYTCP